MNTLLKLSSVKKDKNCNCISPFHLEELNSLNPQTNRAYTTEDKEALKTALFRISNAKGCDIGVCCDPKDPFTSMDKNYVDRFKAKYPKIYPKYNGSQLVSISLSTTKDVNESGWIDPTPYFICKITKAKITDTNNPNIKSAVNLVNDCFVNNCNEAEKITLDNLLANKKSATDYTYFDDARVVQAIRDGNIGYVREYITKYKQVNMALTNDDYSNRLVHIAAESKNSQILEMLIALKADLNIVNKALQTPIMFAVRAKRFDNMEILLNQGVDLSIADTEGNTPMFYALETGDMRIMAMLFNNNAPVIIVNNKGNNLIHHCILKCPSSGKASNDEEINKAKIIRFLLEHGVSSEQKNKEGKTPLELVSSKIEDVNMATNEKKQSAIVKELKQTVNEHFFNMKPRQNKENFQTEERYGGSMNPEYTSLLEIQTLLFNNVLLNNPDKFNKYISVDDIPKGAPIDVLDTVCVGGVGITGNEDSDECVSKGGQLVKVKNKTTKIKLDLIPDNDVAIDKVSEEELYYKKIQPKYPSVKVPDNIKNYNDKFTFLIGESSTNELNKASPSTQDEESLTLESDTVKFEKSPIPTLERTPDTHPPEISEEEMVKSTTDAIRNSEKIVATTSTTAQKSGSENTDSYIQKNWVTILIILLAILIGLAAVYYIFFVYKKH